jgi:hypothetical protein
MGNLEFDRAKKQAWQNAEVADLDVKREAQVAI